MEPIDLCSDDGSSFSSQKDEHSLYKENLAIGWKKTQRKRADSDDYIFSPSSNRNHWKMKQTNKRVDKKKSIKVKPLDTGNLKQTTLQRMYKSSK